MLVSKTMLDGVLLINPELHHDDRGIFLEMFNANHYFKMNKSCFDFAQDNISHSVKNTLRGLHYQAEPYEQSKLVQVINGEIFDVVVSILPGSNFGKWQFFHLDSLSYKQLWIPSGYAHGFCVMSDTADVIYKTTQFYNKNSERIIAWNDPTLDIPWPINNPILSNKDALGTSLSEHRR